MADWIACLPNRIQVGIEPRWKRVGRRIVVSLACAAGYAVAAFFIVWMVI